MISNSSFRSIPQKRAGLVLGIISISCTYVVGLRPSTSLSLNVSLSCAAAEKESAHFCNPQVAKTFTVYGFFLRFLKHLEFNVYPTPKTNLRTQDNSDSHRMVLIFRGRAAPDLYDLYDLDHVYSV